MPKQSRSKPSKRNNPIASLSKKEQREYEHIKNSARKTGRYKGREKEVAARTVMKHHKQRGHAK